MSVGDFHGNPSGANFVCLIPQIAFESPNFKKQSPQKAFIKTEDLGNKK